MMYRTALLLITLLFLTSQAVADQIVLKNGDRLTGAIVKSDGKTIVFKSDLVGEVTVSLDNVESVTADKPLYITTSDGRTLNGLVTTKNNEFEIKPNNGAPVVIDRSAIAVVRSEAEQKVYESTLNPGLFEQWSGGADVGFALTRGNSTTTNLALGMAISRETLRDKTSLTRLPFTTVRAPAESRGLQQTLFASVLATIATSTGNGLAMALRISNTMVFRI